ncbi:uncharacterized protein V1510DRAFT_419560 [Dipodascopsis tothii]|uniref:uncharacterized protein n=1 Tax=Dipodascopsis tothii TaxID=44089 RepID=UPI0034CE5238
MKAVARVANAEFLLWRLFADVRQNPFLVHFVETHAALAARVAADPAAVDVVERFQFYMVSAVLSRRDNGALAATTPREFIDAGNADGPALLARLGPVVLADYAADVARLGLRPAELRRLRDGPAHEFGADSLFATDFRPARMCPALLARPLERAAAEELSPDECQALALLVAGNEDVAVSVLVPAALAELCTHNPRLARTIVRLLLASAQRAPALELLTRLPPTLPALEHVKGVLQVPELAAIDRATVLHGFLETATHTLAETAGAAGATAGAGLPVAADGADPLSLTEFVGRLTAPPAPPQLDDDQKRHVQLLCLFVESLLRERIVYARDCLDDIQTLATTSAVPEAHALLQSCVDGRY